MVVIFLFLPLLFSSAIAATALKGSPNACNVDNVLPFAHFLYTAVLSYDRKLYVGPGMPKRLCEMEDRLRSAGVGGDVRCVDARGVPEALLKAPRKNINGTTVSTDQYVTKSRATAQNEYMWFRPAYFDDPNNELVQQYGKYTLGVVEALYSKEIQQAQGGGPPIPIHKVSFGALFFDPHAGLLKLYGERTTSAKRIPHAMEVDLNGNNANKGLHRRTLFNEMKRIRKGFSRSSMFLDFYRGKERGAWPRTCHGAYGYFTCISYDISTRELILNHWIQQKLGVSGNTELRHEPKKTTHYPLSADLQNVVTAGNILSIGDEQGNTIVLLRSGLDFLYRINLQNGRKDGRTITEVHKIQTKMTTGVTATPYLVYADEVGMVHRLCEENGNHCEHYYSLFGKESQLRSACFYSSAYPMEIVMMADRYKPGEIYVLPFLPQAVYSQAQALFASVSASVIDSPWVPIYTIAVCIFIFLSGFICCPFCDRQPIPYDDLEVDFVYLANLLDKAEGKVKGQLPDPKRVIRAGGIHKRFRPPSRSESPPVIERTAAGRDGDGMADPSTLSTLSTPSTLSTLSPDCTDTVPTDYFKYYVPKEEWPTVHGLHSEL